MEEEKKLDISVILVNYNTKDLLYNCLKSIYKHTSGVSYEIIVSDNGSIDGSLEMLEKEFPKVIIVKNMDNLGFGKANNRGVEQARGKYVFLLNTDTIITNNSLYMFYQFAEKNENYIVGAYLRDREFNVINSYGDFTRPIKALLRKYYDYFPFLLSIRKKHIKTPCLENRIVDFVTGADMFLAKSNYLLCNGFDENFFMYHEDDDLCRTAKNLNIKSIVIEGPIIQHLEGASSKVKVRKLCIQDKSYLYYCKKWNNNSIIFIYLLFFISFPIRLFSRVLSIKDKIFLLRSLREVCHE